jgi:hypothetical protein
MATPRSGPESYFYFTRMAGDNTLVQVMRVRWVARFFLTGAGASPHLRIEMWGTRQFGDAALGVGEAKADSLRE